MDQELHKLRQVYPQKISALGESMKNQYSDLSGALLAHAVQVAQIHVQSGQLKTLVQQSSEDYRQILMAAVKTLYDIDLSNIIEVTHQLSKECYVYLLTSNDIYFIFLFVCGDFVMCEGSFFHQKQLFHFSFFFFLIVHKCVPIFCQFFFCDCL